MSNANRKLKLFVPYFTLISFLSLFAALAEAENGASWMIEGKNYSKKEIVKAEQEKGFTLLTTVGAQDTPIEIVCTLFEIDNGYIEAEGRGQATLLFTGCHTFSKKALGPCDPDVPITVKVKGLPFSHGGEGYILFSPYEGEVFTTIRLGGLPKSECSIGPDVPLTGSIVGEDPNGSFFEEDWVHLIQEAPTALFSSDGLKFGSKTAKLDGSAFLFLAFFENWSSLSG